jgi:GNAT superfamily N-acetyltransferase
LKDFAPPERNTDISRQFVLYLGQSYFHPIVAELAGEMVGCANGLLNQTTGWLGNIVVLPESRQRGTGLVLTAYLVEYFLNQGCSCQVLVVTKLGEPVYTKLGFTVRSTYTFLRSTRAIPARPTPHIRKVEPRDLEALRELDREITGEKRAAFLERFLAGGWVYQTDMLDQLAGFFLPDLPGGPVIARDAEAGMELLQFKLGRGCTSVVVPSANQPALDFLLGAGFQVESTARRMTLGTELDWKPGGVFSRGSGYCR